MYSVAEQDRVSEQQVARAREIDLVAFLQSYEQGELKRVGNSWTLRRHDSMRISQNGKWNWFSRGIGGGDAISFVQAVYGFSFQQAVRLLAGETYQALPAIHKEVRDTDPHEAFSLPAKHTDHKRVFAYLHKGRGIDPEILNHCFKRGLLYESADKHNAVFVGCDTQGQARYAFLRSTLSESNFKCEQTGSDKQYAFCMRGTEGKTLFVCEAAIDALSVATLRKLGGCDWRKGSYLALGGVAASKEHLPVALAQTLQDANYQQVVLCLDNDQAGARATRAIFDLLTEQHPSLTVKVCTPREKDFNEQLLAKLRENVPIPPTKGDKENTLAK